MSRHGQMDGSGARLRGRGRPQSSAARLRSGGSAAERRGLEVSIPRASHLERPGLTHPPPRRPRPGRLRRSGRDPGHEPGADAASTSRSGRAGRRWSGWSTRRTSSSCSRPTALRGALRDASARRRRRAVAADPRPAHLRASPTELERAFLPVAAARRDAAAAHPAALNGFKVDFYWPDLGLVVETDGLRYHRTPAEQAADRLRDQAHTAAGLTQLRFTHDQVKYEPAHVRRILAATRAPAGPAEPVSWPP